MSNQKPEYRIVRKFDGFFSKWCYYLEKKTFNFFLGERWKEVAGNPLRRSIPDEWRKLNIVEEIEQEV